jgi:hypothetical protein
LSTSYDTQALAGSVSRFTVERWCADHAEGFKRALSHQPGRPVAVESDRHGQRGVFYVAYGEPARQCARGALESFKRYMPAIPVALVSDAPLGGEDIFIQHEDEDIAAQCQDIDYEARANGSTFCI